MPQQRTIEVNGASPAERLHPLVDREWFERVDKRIKDHVEESIRELQGISSRALRQA